VAPKIQVQKAVEPASPSRELITLAIKCEIEEHEHFQEQYVGDYTDIPRFRKLMFDEDANTEEMQGYKECAGPLRKLLDNHFYDYYQDHLHTEFDRRDLNVCREKVEYRTRFHDARADRAATKARENRKKGKAVKVTTSSGLPSYKRPTSDVKLESDFRKYLTNDTGKTMDPLSRITVEEYVRRVFSEMAYNSLKSFLRRLPIYGPDFEIWQLMFQTNNKKQAATSCHCARGDAR
jgi:hypothetical protein